MTNAERENFSPLGRPTATDAMFAAPLPWVALNRSFGLPAASPLGDPEAVGFDAQLVNLIGAVEVAVWPPCAGERARQVGRRAVGR